MKLNIQLFGGRGASSSKNSKSKQTKKANNKMVRIYKTLSSGYKYLDAYKYNDYTINIENESRPYSMFGTKKWYHVTLKSGEKWTTDTLKEIKKYIDDEIQKNKKTRGK